MGINRELRRDDAAGSPSGPAFSWEQGQLPRRTNPTLGSKNCAGRSRPSGPPEVLDVPGRHAQSGPACRGGRLGWALRLLDNYRPTAGDTDLREWEWHFLSAAARKALLAETEEMVLPWTAEGIDQLAWSGDGQRLAAVGLDGAVVVWDTRTGKELRRMSAGARIVNLDRAGQRLTIIRQDGSVRLYECETDRTFSLFPAANPGRRPVTTCVVQPGWPAGGVRRRGVDAMIVYDATTGQTVRLIEGHRSSVLVAAWDDTSRRLATGDRDGLIKIWDMATGQESATLKEEGGVLGLQWGTGGRQIAAAIQPDRVRIWDVARRERVFAADAGGLQVEVPLLRRRPASRLRIPVRHHHLANRHGAADLPNGNPNQRCAARSLRPSSPALGGC